MKVLKRRVVNYLLLLFIITINIFLMATGCDKIKKPEYFELTRFIAPRDCGLCHKTIYKQWENSMHNQAYTDPVYHDMAHYFLKGLTDKDEIEEAESCVKCHAPLGYAAGDPLKLSEERDDLPDIVKKGISCDYCHSATDVHKDYNNGLVLEPGNGASDPGTKRGPFKDSESIFHESAYSELHTSSRICGTCHDVKHVVFGTKLESPYEEWLAGPYHSDDPDKNVSCQGCHMYQRPGIPATGSTKRPKNPGKAAPDGPDREHIFTHYMIGGNSFLPALQGDSEKEAMAVARLTNAAELTIEAPGPDRNSFTIHVKNSGAGHNLPTGLTNVRQMWLEITVLDRNENLVFSSGVPDRDGYLPVETIIYNTVFGDKEGNPVENVAKAHSIIFDKRIPPLESSSEIIPLPAGEWGRLTVRVKLNYRIASQEIIDTLYGKGKMVLPIVVMEETEMVF